MHVLDDEKQIGFVIISGFRNIKYLPMNIFFGRDLGGKAKLGRQLPTLILVHLLNRFCTRLDYINLTPGSGMRYETRLFCHILPR